MLKTQEKFSGSSSEVGKEPTQLAESLPRVPIPDTADILHIPKARLTSDIFQKNSLIAFCSEFCSKLASDDVRNNKSFVEGMAGPAPKIVSYYNVYKAYVKTHI